MTILFNTDLFSRVKRSTWAWARIVLAVSRNDVNKPEHEILRERQSPFILFPKNHVWRTAREERERPQQEFPLQPHLAFLAYEFFKSWTHQAPLIPCDVKHSKTDSTSHLINILWSLSLSTRVNGSLEKVAFCCHLASSSALHEGIQGCWGLVHPWPTSEPRARRAQ